MGILWSRSGQVERDDNDVRANGAKAYFYEGGITTPLTVYEDAAETTPHGEDDESSLHADGNGRWPAVFIPFTESYDVKVTTSGGVLLYYYREIPNADPVDTEEDSVDANALLAVGDFLMSIDSSRPGFVRANGLLIGDASSGATERANADTENLFGFVWNKLSNTLAPVSSGRGASAVADFAAHKTITLPDLRGGVLRGADDMGNTAASRLATATFSLGGATAVGSVCGGGAAGGNTQTLSEANLPSHLHTISLTSGPGGEHSHGVTVDAGGDHSHGGVTGNQTTTVQITAVPSTGTALLTAGGSSIREPSTAALITVPAHVHTIAASGTHTHSASDNVQPDHTHAIFGNTGSVGSGTAHNVVSRSTLVTIFMKL